MRKSVEAPEAMTPEELRDWRESLGLGRTLFARALGVARSAVKKWEYGERPVPAWLTVVRDLTILVAELEAKLQGQ